MDCLADRLGLGLTIEDFVNYDRRIRENPFDFPKAPDLVDLATLGLYREDLDDRDYESTAAVEALLIQNAQHCENYFEALIRYLLQVDLPKIDLQYIVNELKQYPRRPSFIGKIIESIDCGYTQLSVWLAWSTWAMKVHLIYLEIVDRIIDRPFPDVPWHWGFEVCIQEETSLRRTIASLMPFKMTREQVEANEAMVREQMKMRDLEKDLEKMAIGV